MPNISSITFALTILLSTYLTAKVFTPPNPNQSSSLTKSTSDTIAPIVTPQFISFQRIVIIVVGLYHALLAVTYSSPPSVFCPRPENLNPSSFTWNWHSVLCLMAILLAAPVRILTFKQLGPNFTFKLAPPVKLVKTGLYAYIQHPSYTMNVIIVTAHGLLFDRMHAGPACWLSRNVIDSFWWDIAAGCCVLLAVCLTIARVRDEEAMLQEKFGQEWEAWHASTKRFIPWIF